MISLATLILSTVAHHMWTDNEASFTPPPAWRGAQTGPDNREDAWRGVVVCGDVRLHTNCNNGVQQQHQHRYKYQS